MQNIEKEWVTEAGLRAKVVIQPMGFRCGYVGVNAETFKGVHYDELDIEVHGGLTYARTEMDGLRWYGFDCGHLGDRADIELMDEKHRESSDSKFWLEAYDSTDTIKSLDFCVSECENLATQLKQLEDAE